MSPKSRLGALKEKEKTWGSRGLETLNSVKTESAAQTGGTKGGRGREPGAEKVCGERAERGNWAVAGAGRRA